MSLTWIHEDVGLIPGLTQCVKDTALLWAVVVGQDAAQILYCCAVALAMPAAIAPIRPLAWEPPYAVGAAIKRLYKHTHTHIHTHIHLYGEKKLNISFHYPSIPPPLHKDNNLKNTYFWSILLNLLLCSFTVCFYLCIYICTYTFKIYTVNIIMLFIWFCNYSVFIYSPKFLCPCT